MIKLRRLSLDDFDDAFALYTELTRGMQPVADKARFADVLNTSGTEIIGAEKNGAIVSMATMHILANMTFGGRPYVLVENVVTRENMHGKGFGRAVMEEVKARAWDADAYKIMLLTGTTLGARGFYEKLGYRGDEKHAMTLRRAPVRGD